MRRKLEHIAKRDGYLCHLCELPVFMDAQWPDPGYPVLDHVIPMALGGTDEDMNLALAHWLCNSTKGGRG